MNTTALSIDPQSLSRFADTPKFRIHYYESGQGHPLVLLHGSGPGANGWTNFQHNIPHLARTNRVIAVDMPGWGQSDTQTSETGYDHPAALIALLDALDIDRAALIGNSLGGTTAIEVALRAPERVSHLVTMGAPFPGKNYFSAGNGASEGQKILDEAYRTPTAGNMKRLVEIMCFDPAWATDELARQRSAAAQERPDHLQSYLARPLPRPYFSLGAQMGRIEVPTLAIHGRDDRVVSYEHSLRLVSTLPQSRLLLINRCGHWVQIEHAAEFNRVTAQFVAGA
ncbi:2-hydroxy-6-oxonona-2,4-dienedioate hydrolase [Kibdelosporangium banguiense]|uniref:2-hydroxy-6-oxonona-2,4-dienedioate hydrolase n=1 Tax=Kibdelosporangium banguiense TaxID=1365924 RepID=A0ABS4TXW8_9PSEU|nr:alpha/beta hydrolase [Kibdelosporangium banguiense]MBP2329226.1 2-hydroxy-6-oxonona-2,4-dienedioate hydrolase [Kibdelosporangium banguiense]